MPAESEDSCYFVDLYPDGDDPHVLSSLEQEIVEKINQKIADHSSLEEIITFVFQTMGPIRASDRFSLAFFEEEGRRLVSHHAEANYKSIRIGKGWADDVTGSSLKELIDGNRARIINDLETYVRVHPHSRSTKVILREGIRSSRYMFEPNTFFIQ